MDIESTRSRARAAARRGVDWLRELLQPDGRFRGATSLDCYYKAPCALTFAGHPEDAGRVLDFAESRFLLPDGDLDGTGVSWYESYRIYPHAWLAWGAAVTGRPRMASAIAAFLETRRNPESGGFRAGSGDIEEIMTTSAAGLALLRTGRRDLAESAGRWLERVLDAQPDLERGLIHVWHPGKGLDEGDGSVSFRIDASQPRQWYFQYGIAAALLASLARDTGDTRWLALAQRYLHASAHCHEDRYRTPQSGKIGWGAAWIHALSRDPRDAALIAAVTEGLTALQGGDGSWNGEGVYHPRPAPDTAVARLDVTAEFVALLSIMGTADSE